MAPGVAGLFRWITSVFFVLLPQALLAFTLRVSLALKPPLKLITMEVVPWPLFMTPPAGGVQVYDAAPLTACMVYVRELPGHTLAPPPVTVMVPGIAGTLQVTVVCCVVSLEQPLPSVYVYVMEYGPPVPAMEGKKV